MTSPRITRRAFALSIASCAMLAATARAADGPVKKVRGLEPFDELMAGFLQTHKIPGASLAVTKNGRLVYAKGFGSAGTEKRETVGPQSLFRIASVAKPITAVAVLRLVEGGLITLDSKVFDLLNLQAKIPQGATFDPRWKEITIRRLLQHTGGWDRDKSFDPMFRQVDFARQFNAIPPASPEQIIRAMLGVPLDFKPGERFAYSNFGYCVLGRVIEAVSGQPYEQAVRSSVLAPLKITGMMIARTRLIDRARREVRYITPAGAKSNSIFPEDFGKPVPISYGAYSLETLDAHGGWIATAADLVRFASAFDETSATPPLLQKATVDAMFARPDGLAGHEPNGSPKDAYYGFGWMVRPTGNGRQNTWHTGSLDGSSTLLVRRHDGLDWAVLFNTRDTPTRVEPAAAIDPLVHQAADRVKTWPDIDLFPKILPEPNAS